MKKSDANPNATIQIDRSDVLDALVEDLDGEAGPRHTPPPLPPEAFDEGAQAPWDGAEGAPMEGAQDVPPASGKRALVWGIVLVLLVAGAIFGGLKVGSALSPAPVAASAPQPSASAPAPPPTASATATAAVTAAALPGVITIPTVEFRDPR